MVKTVMVYNDFDPIPDRVLDRMCDNGVEHVCATEQDMPDCAGDTEELMVNLLAARRRVVCLTQLTTTGSHEN